MRAEPPADRAKRDLHIRHGKAADHVHRESGCRFVHLWCSPSAARVWRRQTPSVQRPRDWCVVHADRAGALDQRQGGIDRLLRAHGVDHRIKRPAEPRRQILQFRQRGEHLARPERLGLAPLAGVAVHQPHVAEPQQRCEAGKAQPHRPGTDDHHRLLAAQAEIVESGVHLAPSAQHQCCFHGNLRRHHALDLVHVGPAGRLVRHPIGHHRRVVAGQHVLREATVAAPV